MSLWKIAWKSITQRGLASSLTALSMALGVALVVAVLVIHGLVQESFTRGATGYHLLVGKKGSQFQLVLNAVYFLQDPIENIPYSYYKEFLSTPGHEGKYASMVDVAVPFCLGDSYQGFRVVATNTDMFDKLEYARGKPYTFEPGGRNFKQEEFFTAVIGSTVARETGLKVGSDFQPTHGLEKEGHKHDAFRVVGILKPTGTPNDRALFTNMEGFYLLEDHAKEPEETKPAAPSVSVNDRPKADDGIAHASGANCHPEDADHPDHDHADHDHDEHDEHGHAHHHEPLPESQREVTAILVRCAGGPASDVYSQALRKEINKGQVAQAVAPIRVVNELFSKLINQVQVLLLVLTVLIVIVSGIGMMVSIYNSMSERRRDIAIMRSLGAGRRTVLGVVLLESVLLAVGGGLAGLLLGHLLVAVSSPLVEAQAGVSVGALQFVPEEVILIPGLMLLATLAGFLPGMTAYNTDVSRVLSANP